MAFTPVSYPLLTPQQASPYADLVKNALAMYSGGINARYQPQMLRADIFGKSISPLAQIASNPLLLSTMAQNPDQLRKFTEIISNVLQNSPFGQTGSQPISSNVSVPPISNGNYNAQPQISNIPQNSNQQVDYNNIANSSGGNLPSNASNVPTQAGIGGAYQKVTAPLSMQLYPAGTTYRDQKTGEIRTTAAPQTLSSIEVGQGAIQVAVPMIKKLQDEGDDLLSSGRFHKYVSSELVAALEGAGISDDTLKKWGISRDYYDKWVQFKRDQASTIERLQTAYNYPQTNEGQEMAAAKIRPAMFENSKSYRDSLDKELNLLNQQNQTYQSQLSSGFQSTPGAEIESPPKNVTQAIIQSANNFKNQPIRVRGPDPRDNNKIKTFEIPQALADKFLSNGYVRAY